VLGPERAHSAQVGEPRGARTDRRIRGAVMARKKNKQAQKDKKIKKAESAPKKA
jgi:hypothetical protein